VEKKAVKLTKRTIEGLPTTDKRYEVRDDSLPGFLAHVGETGKKAFYYVYRAGKGRAAASSGKSLPIAKFLGMHKPLPRAATRICRQIP